jgi:hypothetical protein
LFPRSIGTPTHLGVSKLVPDIDAQRAALLAAVK